MSATLTGVDHFGLFPLE